jgi:hypothetical protein
MNKICYTALIGDYDKLMPPAFNPDWRFICFTTEKIQVKGWEMIMVEPWKCKVRQARFIKCIPPFIDKCPSLWIDARFQIIGSLDEFLKGVKSNLAIMSHPVRTTVQEEADEIIRIGLDTGERVYKQIKKYSHVLETHRYILPAAGILYRKAPTDKFNITWWNEIKKGSHRDQLSFNYAAITSGTKFDILPGGIYDRDNKYYYLHKHKS